MDGPMDLEQPAVRTGGSIPFDFAIDSLTLRDGEQIKLPPRGLTVVTGGNNTGKSLFLRELVTTVQTGIPSEEHLWIRDVEPRWCGDAEAFFAWLARRGVTSRTKRGQEVFAEGGPHDGGRETPRAELAQAWNSQTNHAVFKYLVAWLWTDQRLQDTTMSQRWAEGTHLPSDPAQYLWLHQDMHERISTWIGRAFGLRLHIDRHDVAIQLRLGTEPEPPRVPPPAPETYTRWFADLPLVREQGDGVRSFVNILLNTMVKPAAVVVIDEPEAFLHPPQARLLGKILAEEQPAHCQVVVATHSADFLHGVLETRPDETRLIRLARTPGRTRAHTLEPGDVRDVFADAFSRYANIVSGLFHDGVVICEAEGDCRFYSATLEALTSKQPSAPDPNLSYIHVGGKGRLDRAAAKLRALGIPCVVIADLDMLDDKKRMRKLTDALGGRWDDLQPHLDVLHRAAGSEGGKFPSVTRVRAEIGKILGNADQQEALTKRDSEAVRAVTRATTYWDTLKAAGAAALKPAEVRALKALLPALAELGVFLVPVGELERWHRDIDAGNKNTWLLTVFERNLHTEPSTELADFTRSYLAYLTRDPQEHDTAPIREHP